MSALPSDLELVDRCPTLSEFKALRADAGWGCPPDENVERALANTLLAVCAETKNGATAAMGRVVGDGGVQFFITDLIVLRQWQNRGIGAAIMARLMEYVRERAAPGAFVGLFSALGRHGFYERFGFTVRPNDKLGPGMMFPVRHTGKGTGTTDNRTQPAGAAHA